MIDQEVFMVEWAVLSERFNRDPSTVLAARYYQSLSPRMDTQEFRRAARSVFDSCEFFPRPDDFLDALGERAEELALDQWQLCESVMRGNPRALERMSPAGRRTVKLLGGPDRLRSTAIDEVRWVRREFFRIFDHAEAIDRRERQAALPPWTPADSERIREVASDLRLLEDPSDDRG